MPIVTLTTDLGSRDHYAGLLKAGIVSRNREVQILDISHEVEPFNISQAAFILKNVYTHFPSGSIHVLFVNTGYTSFPEMVIAELENQLLIGPDNGVLSLLADGKSFDQIFSLPRKRTQSLYESIGENISRLINQEKLTDFAKPLTALRPSIGWQPYIENDFIKGRVIYIDRFQNCIVNIQKKQFEETRKGRKVRVYFKRYDDIHSISESYADVPEGEKLVWFNNDDMLEIAIHNGKASGLLGLQVNDMVQVDFI